MQFKCNSFSDFTLLERYAVLESVTLFGRPVLYFPSTDTIALVFLLSCLNYRQAMFI